MDFKKKYIKYKSKYYNLRDLIKDFSEKNEINSFSPEDKIEFRKLKILQTKINQKMLRHNIKVRKQKIEKLENEKKWKNVLN